MSSLINNIFFSLSLFVDDFEMNFDAKFWLDEFDSAGGACTGNPVGVEGVPPSWYDASPGVGLVDEDNALVECWFIP